MWKLITEAWRYRYVTENFVRSNLANKYKSSVLGYLWSVLLPLVRYLLMALVFTTILNIGSGQYMGSLVIGLVCFQFFTGALTAGVHAFTANAGYIKKLYVPKLTFILNVVFFELVNYLLVLLGSLVLCCLGGFVTLKVGWFFALLGILNLTIALIGMVALVSIAMVWFRDIQYIVDVLVNTLFFVTPILYPAHLLPAWVYQMNPVYYLILFIQKPLVDGVLPASSELAAAVALAVGFLLVGLALLTRFQDKIYYKL